MSPPAMPVELVGREAELERIRQWVGLRASGAAGLLVRGEPGIGKTSVWAAAVEAARAAGAVALVARPVEGELQLGYGGLGDLLGGVAGSVLDHLPEPLSTAMTTALLLRREVEAAEPHAVARGTLETLRMLSARSPILVAVDDVQWLDAASARALAFAMRRLGDLPVAFVISLRDGHAEPLGLADALGERMHGLPLGGLSAAAIGHLVRVRVDPDLTRRAVTRIHQRSGGNPFFALELARAGDEALPMSLREVVAHRLASVAAEASAAVELAAVLAPAPTSAFPTDALDVAVAAGVLVDLDGEVRFSHPLLAAGAYDGLPPGRRRALHRRAAELTIGEVEHARHMALAASGPDDAIATLLDAAARDAAARGAPETAAELAGRARRLTPPDDADAAMRRAMDEADYLSFADERAARVLVDEVLATGARGTVRVRALIQKALHEKDAPAAVARLEEAVREPHDDRFLATAALSALAWQRACWLGDVGPAVDEAATAVELADELGDARIQVTTLTTAAFVAGLAGDARSAGWYERALALEERVRLPAGRRPHVSYAHDRWWRGDWATAATHLATVREDAERAGDEASLLRLEIFAAEFALRRGDWDEAERLLESALTQAREYWRVVALTRRAMLRARRGDPRSLADAQEVIKSPIAHNDRVIAAMAECAIGLFEMANGRTQEAADRLGTLGRIMERAGARVPELAALIPDAVASLVGTGRTDDASALVVILRRHSSQLDPWGAAAAALCRGLILLVTGDFEATMEQLERARKAFEEMPAPWELAQTLLAQGHALRRAGRRREAAHALERAASLFSDLGAEPWRSRAQDELRRARPRPRRDDSLTIAESRVAALVAAGRTNREVAAELFTTVATVEAHLTRIYRKLDLRSRTELARAVAEERVQLET